MKSMYEVTYHLDPVKREHLENLMILALNNPLLFKCIKHYQYGEWDYETFLIETLKCFIKQNEQLETMLTKMAEISPSNTWIRPDEM